MTRAPDLAVIGGGPAGAVAALAAARAGLSVALFEPQRGPIDKPCGEGILPSGVAALEALGLGALVARGQPIDRIRYVLASGRELELPLGGGGVALERPELSAALAALVACEPGIERVPRRAEVERPSERSAGGFRVRAGASSWTARTLVAADGLGGSAAAWLRGPRARPARPARPLRHGIRARAQLLEPLRHVEVHLARGGRGGSEVYLTPLPGGRVNVAVLLDAEGAPDRGAEGWLAEALREHPLAARRLGEWTTEPEARRLTLVRPRRTAGAGAFLAGDATGGVDPVLGCGVAIALATGLAAAHSAVEVVRAGSGAPERRYARLVRRETSLRGGVARALLFLSARPGLQDVVARALAAWPTAARRLATAVGGGGTRTARA